MALPNQQRDGGGDTGQGQSIWRRRWSGPSRKEVWGELAKELGGRFEQGRWMRNERVVHEVGPWVLTMEMFVVMAGSAPIPFTRIRAPFVSNDNFRFALSKENFLTPVARWLGAQDVVTGFGDFDKMFVVKTTSEPKVKQLVAEASYRQLLLANADLRVDVVDNEGFLSRKYPTNVDLLNVTVNGDVRDMARLEAMFDVAATTMERLHDIGTAADRPALMGE